MQAGVYPLRQQLPRFFPGVARLRQRHRGICANVLRLPAKRLSMRQYLPQAFISRSMPPPPASLSPADLPLCLLFFTAASVSAMVPFLLQ